MGYMGRCITRRSTNYILGSSMNAFTMAFSAVILARDPLFAVHQDLLSRPRPSNCILIYLLLMQSFVYIAYIIQNLSLQYCIESRHSVGETLGNTHSQGMHYATTIES